MVNLYYHGGSQNHGCEAIVRSTAKLFGNAVLWSFAPDQDKKYGINNIVVLEHDSQSKLGKLEKLWVAVQYKLRKDDYWYYRLTHKKMFRCIKPGDVFLSIGGDNYCYEGRDILGYYNSNIHRKGGRTVLWGCSFEEKDLTPAIAEDISRYDLIVTREQLSYECLKKVNSNTVLYPDPAFQMDAVKTVLPLNFIPGNTIGLNISPLIMKSERVNGATVANYTKLIQHILDDTDCCVALIPHVVEQGNDDREPMELLYKQFETTGRVLKVEDCTAPELKYVISQCRMFVGARTHATIAAYSTCVPTLVVGYSVKARGIARELFGEEEGYVLPVQRLQQEDDLLHAFAWLMANENKIRNDLKNRIPGYAAQCFEAAKRVKALVNEE